MRPTLSRFASSQNAGELLDRVRNVVQQTRDRLRTHVVSRKLCDESLERLQSTLPSPGTCDIIDINPGVCIWSEAVHDFLKPRRHVLVETSRKTYAEFIDPLLQRPGSAFRYAPDLPSAISPQSGLLSPDVTKPRSGAEQQKDQDLGRAIVENKTLLVIANLTRANKSNGFSGSEGKRFLSNYYRSLFSSNEYIHRYGLVRLLAWIDEYSARAVLPISIAGQTKQSIQLDAAFDIRGVAGPEAYKTIPHVLRRWYKLNEENLSDVRTSEAEMGLTTPSDRAIKTLPRPLQSYPPSTEFLSKHRSWFPESRKFISDLLDLEARLAVEEPEWLHSYTQKHEKGFLRAGKPSVDAIRTKTPDQRLYRQFINQLHTYSRRFHKLEAMIEQHRSLWRQIQSCQLRQTTDETKEYVSLLNQYDKLEKETRELAKDNGSLVYKAVDDYRAYDSTPRTMSWNRRTFEPLLVRPDEFYPRHPLALIDLTPRVEFVNRLDTVDKVICFDYLITALSMFRGDTVIQAVQRLVGAGYEKFVSQIPELYDINRGGFHKVEYVRLRSLHWSLFVRLAEEYEKWPYRPPIEQLINPASTVFDKPI